MSDTWAEIGPPRHVTTNLPGPATPVGSRLYTPAEVAAAERRGMERAAGIVDAKVHHALPISDREWNEACRSCATAIRAALQPQPQPQPQGGSDAG